MRLYHFTPARVLAAVLTAKSIGLGFSLVLALAALLAGCAPQPAAPPVQIGVTLQADGQLIPVKLSPGSTVENALAGASVQLGPLDRAEPPAYTVLADGAEVKVVRVTEKFEIEQVVIPFDRQTLRNESLAKDQQVLLQPGGNGLQEITYRRVYEDGVDISGQPSPIKYTVVKEPVPEIMMVGIQAPFYPVEMPGKLVYLRDGNAWVIQENTGKRRAVVTSGDLDGRIFSLSDDGNWLLFTRRAVKEGQINGLWVADIRGENGKLIDLKVPNVIHFADWVPGSTSKIVFSTVEPRATAPGWQANNDLKALTFSLSGWTTKWSTIIEANSGGVYGWWGTSFRWAPDNRRLAFARPDSLGLVDFYQGTVTDTLKLVPMQTRSDWAWVPGMTWGPDGKVLYLVNHTPPAGASAPEESQDFDLAAIPLGAGQSLSLVSQSGMFAYPLASPLLAGPQDEVAYQVAYLQAAYPTQSETSRYRVALMDRDGSNRRLLFPEDGSAGLSPQENWGAWSPQPLPASGAYALAVLYEGNLWLVDTSTGQAQQITGDGLTTRVIWQ